MRGFALNTICVNAVILVWAVASVAPMSAHADDPLSGEALFRDVARYDAFGIHRSGTPGDLATSAWVASELAAAGYAVKRDTWHLRQFMLEDASLTVGGRSLDCFPFWYPHDTGDGPVQGALASLTENPEEGSLEGHIAFIAVEGRNWRFDIRDLVERSANAGAIGLVVALESPSGEPVAQNAPAPHNQTPHRIPALIVAHKHAESLMRAAREGALASLSIRGRDVPNAESSNVAAKLIRGDKWIVVTTPLSGWFTCAGERGPGVALFLGLARWAAEREGTHSLLFLGNTGHELDQIGAHSTLEENAPPIEDVSLWIHLGASIAAREYGPESEGFPPLDRIHEGGNLVGTKALGPILNAAFAEVDSLQPRTEGPVFGELREFMNAGYNAYGFFGNFLYFHTALDSGPVTTPALLEPIGAAIAQTIEAID